MPGAILISRRKSAEFRAIVFVIALLLVIAMAVIKSQEGASRRYFRMNKAEIIKGLGKADVEIKSTSGERWMYKRLAFEVTSFIPPKIFNQKTYLEITFHTNGEVTYVKVK